MEDPTKRRHHQRLFGHIISAVGERKYLVRFDDGTEKECPSAVLREERVAASLPPDVQVPITSTQVEAMEAITSTQVEAMEAEDVQEEIADQDERQNFQIYRKWKMRKQQQRNKQEKKRPKKWSKKWLQQVIQLG
jgi:hypothetical protein